jgi:hypothetical protein
LWTFFFVFFDPSISQLESSEMINQCLYVICHQYKGGRCYMRVVVLLLNWFTEFRYYFFAFFDNSICNKVILIAMMHPAHGNL